MATRVPRVTTAPSPALPALVSPAAAALPTAVSASALEDIASTVGRLGRQGAEVDLTIELDKLKRRAFREDAEANTKIEAATNAMNLKYEGISAFETMGDDFKSELGEQFSEVLSGITNPDVHDQVKARASSLLESNTAKQRFRAEGFEKEAGVAAVVKGMAVLAQSSGLAESDEERAVIKAKVDVLLDSNVEANVIRGPKAEAMKAEWIDGAAEAASRAAIRGPNIGRAIVDIKDITVPKYDGWNPVRRQIQLDAAITEEENRDRVDSAAAIRRRMEQEVIAYNGVDTGEIAGEDGIWRLRYAPEFEDLTAGMKRTQINALRAKANGGDLNRVNHFAVTDIYSKIMERSITTPDQLSASIAAVNAASAASPTLGGFPWQEFGPAMSMLRGLTEGTAESREDARLLNKFYLLVGQAKLMPPNMKGFISSDARVSYFRWLVAMRVRIDDGRKNGVTVLEMVTEESKNYIGKDVMGFKLSTKDNILSFQRDFGVDAEGNTVELEPEAIEEFLPEDSFPSDLLTPAPVEPQDQVRTPFHELAEGQRVREVERAQGAPLGADILQTERILRAIRNDPDAIAAINEGRARRGQPPLLIKDAATQELRGESVDEFIESRRLRGEEFREEERKVREAAEKKHGPLKKAIRKDIRTAQEFISERLGSTIEELQDPRDFDEPLLSDDELFNAIMQLDKK